MSTPAGQPPSLKLKTARTLKWNTIDRLSQQIALAVVGVVLANILSEEDYGLTGVVGMFQAFAIVFVDSGFGAALLQQKEPTERDYSTVFWFNVIVSVAIYAVLWFCAPVIAGYFGSAKLVPLSRVMFLTFIFSALGIVQTNRLMKMMDVRQIALSNLAGLAVSGTVGICMAVHGCGVWSLVWQGVSLAFVKTAWLWVAVRWRPLPVFSRDSMRRICKVGLGVFSSSLLNTFFLNLYTWVIGSWSLSRLGVYIQADKWSKMGNASLSQIITATFVPLLSKFQDVPGEFGRYMRRIDRFAALILFPVMGGMAMVATPLFHTLFGEKWDAAIPFFQILAVRGALLVLISVYNNFLLAAGRAKALVMVETVKDASMLAALVLSFPFGTISALVWGQLASAFATWVVVLLMTARLTPCTVWQLLADLSVPLLLSLAALAAGWVLTQLTALPPAALAAGIAGSVAAYLLLAYLFRLPELREGKEYFLGRFLRKK